MTRDDWLELTVLERKKYNDLIEVQDLTRQLAETLDRNDQVSARMLIAMRQDPIRQLVEINKGEKRRMADLGEEACERVSALRSGDPPRDDGEKSFLEQSAKTLRLLQQVVELDKRVSTRMAGGKSFYHK